MLIHIDTFTHKYLSAIPERLFVKLNQRVIDGEFYCEVPDAVVERIERVKAKRDEDNRRLQECADRNDLGRELEKSGQIDEAIAVYEENIADGYPAAYAFDRLLVLYRKAKAYKDEKRVIKRACAVFRKSPCMVEGYKTRLARVEILMEKAKEKEAKEKAKAKKAK